MDENKIDQINGLFDQLCGRLQREITRGSLKDLEQVMRILLQMQDFKFHTQQSAEVHRKNEQLLAQALKFMKGEGPMPPGMTIEPIGPTEP